MPDNIETSQGAERVRNSFDVFLSYSSSERESCVLPLRERLEAVGLTTWCDVHEIGWGDSIVAKINAGLAGSTFIVAFISKTYLDKPWPLKELNASLATRGIESTCLLPVFLGVTAKEVNVVLPLLSDTRHVSVPYPSPGAAIDDESLSLLTAELQRKLERTRGLSVALHYEAGKLDQTLDIVNYSSSYQSVWMSSKELALHTGRLPRSPGQRYSPESKIGTVVNLLDILRAFFEYRAVEETPRVACSYMIGAHVAFALESGHVVSSGCGYIRESLFDRFTYTVTGAPPHPLVINHGLYPGPALGYEDGTLFVGGASSTAGHLKREHSARIVAIETSERSLLITASENGEIGMWSLEDLTFKGFASKAGSAISCLALNRRGTPRVFASGQVDGVVKVWGFEGSLLSDFRAFDHLISCMAFFPSPLTWLAVASEGTVRVWDHKAKKCLAELSQGGLADVTALHVAEADDFRRSDRIAIVAGFSDGRADIWEMDVS